MCSHIRQRWPGRGAPTVSVPTGCPDCPQLVAVLDLTVLSLPHISLLRLNTFVGLMDRRDSLEGMKRTGGATGPERAALESAIRRVSTTLDTAFEHLAR